jgi:hypothetical protein
MGKVVQLLFTELFHPLFNFLSQDIVSGILNYIIFLRVVNQSLTSIPIPLMA